MVEAGTTVGGNDMADDGKPKIRWWTYALAVVWAALLIGIAFVMRPLGTIHNELGARPPLTARILVCMPAWIVSGLLLAAALIWKSKLLSPKTSGAIDTIAAVFGIGLALVIVVIAMFLPFAGVLMESVQP